MRQRAVHLPGSPHQGSPLKHRDEVTGHIGHRHFWQRAAMSRRGFLGAGMAATAGLLLTPSFAGADGAVTGATPSPIPGGFVFDGKLFHNYAPGVFDAVDADPSGITDFNGHVGYAVIDGSGIGRTASGPVPLSYEVDLRFMQGVYVGVDGRRRRGTFCLI